MPFDSNLANAISNTFRATIQTRLNTPQRTFFESLLQSWFGVKNIRNVQLWTRFGSQTRNFINRNLGDLDLILRTFVATKFVQADTATVPTKTKCWRMPPDNLIARQTFEWFQDTYVSQYTIRIYFQDLFFCIEYSADSDSESEEIDIGSPEFDDLIED